MKHGFIKVAAASPMIRVADADYNADRVIECMESAAKKGVKLLVFPELTLTGRCYDLISHRVLLDGARDALVRILDYSKNVDMLCFVGLPYAAGSRLYSVAAAVYAGELLGLVPQQCVSDPHFALPGDEAIEVSVGEYESFLSTGVLFRNPLIEGLNVAVELGGDLDAVCEPAISHAVAGATVIA